MLVHQSDSYHRISTFAADKDYSFPGGLHPDSLVHPSNRSYLLEILANIRIACCGGGKITLQLKRMYENIASVFASLKSAIGERFDDVCANKVNAVANIVLRK